MRNHVLGATNRVARPLNVFELAPLIADLMKDYNGKRKVGKLMQAYEAAWARLQHHDPGFAQSPIDVQFGTDLLNWLKFHRAMLIGEVIPLFHGYLRTNPAAQERREFAHILVDEFQDLNKAEQDVVRFLSDGADVCIVGDDDQSIYSFKYAHPEGIRDWLELHPNADDLHLDDCRRCPTRVVEMANSLISFNKMRPVPRDLVPIPGNGEGDVRIIQYENLDDEVSGITNIVIDLIGQGMAPGDILVLAQRKEIGTPIYESLIASDIPARSYYSEAELHSHDAQWGFALLKLFADREDRVALRWLVGLSGSNWNAAGYKRIRQHCEESGASPWVVLSALSAGVLKLSYTAKIIEAFTELVGELDALEKCADLEEVVGLLFPLENDSVRDIREIAIALAKGLGMNDRTVFISELTTVISQPDIPSLIEDVRVMSLHKSKGLSAPVTIIAGCVEGLLPRQPDAELPEAEAAAMIEEQRRTFFVGITRVKALPAEGKPGTLVITYARKMSIALAKRALITPASTSYGVANLLASRFVIELGPHAPASVKG